MRWTMGDYCDPLENSSELIPKNKDRPFLLASFLLIIAYEM